MVFEITTNNSDPAIFISVNYTSFLYIYFFSYRPHYKSIDFIDPQSMTTTRTTL